MIHHLNKGDNKCNFNIILPGADFIMGTYRGCVSNKEYYENNNNLSDNDKKLYLKELNKEQLPYGISYCS
jgi:sterol desaturase/sphingolipid hydroxylase (fatty acid hydroxylase superfamily)